MEHKNSVGSRIQVREVKRKSLFPTLFSKLLTLYLSILVVTFIFFFAIFSNAFQKYYVDYTENIMIKQAKLIASEYQEVGSMKQSLQKTLERVFLRVEVLDSYLDATTWIVDRDYNMVVASGKQDSMMMDRKLANPEVIQEVFKGNVISQQTGFEQYFATPVLTVGYPIILGNQIEYALFIHTPMPQIQKIIDEVRDILMKAVFITTSIIFVLIYFLFFLILYCITYVENVISQNTSLLWYFDFASLYKSIIMLLQNIRQLLRHIIPAMRIPAYHIRIICNLLQPVIIL